MTVPRTWTIFFSLPLSSSPFYSFSLSSSCCPFIISVNLPPPLDPLGLYNSTLQLHVPVPLRLFVSTPDSTYVPTYVIGSVTFYYKYPVVAIVRTPALYSFTICESIFLSSSIQVGCWSLIESSNHWLLLLTLGTSALHALSNPYSCRDITLDLFGIQIKNDKVHIKYMSGWLFSTSILFPLHGRLGLTKMCQQLCHVL